MPSSLGVYCYRYQGVSGFGNCQTYYYWYFLDDYGRLLIVGQYIPSWIVGVLIVASAVITAIGGVVQTKNDVPTKEETRANADRIGYKIFIPALTLALVSVVAAWLGLVSGNNAIGVTAVFWRNCGVCDYQSPRPRALLPKEAACWIIWARLLFCRSCWRRWGFCLRPCGVGDVISKGVASIIPDGSRFIAVAVYCIGMALFTIIMGNGFAAFSVITVGVGIPFLIMQGANPVVVGAMGLTAGYCGTLLTPMAANFNIMPAALLETKNKYAIIKAQAPTAVVMLVIHIFLMYFLAF